VKQGETGLVVDGRSIREITDALTALLGDPDLCASMGAAGRDWVQSRWRWEHMAGRLRQLL
jgi:phosphatidylinositol alpha-1,6-mannosyltransferase